MLEEPTYMIAPFWDGILIMFLIVGIGGLMYWRDWMHKRVSTHKRKQK